MIDAALVRRKLVLVVADVRSLEKYARLPLADYLSEPTSELVVERYLERAIGRVLDVNFHIATELGRPPPRDYYSSFGALAELGVLSQELARDLAPAAGLRNRIAHEYDEIDPTKVHSALARALPLLTAYIEAVERFLDAQR